MNQTISTSNGLAFAFLQGAPLAIIAVDARGKLVSVNQQAVQLFGYTEKELLCLGPALRGRLP